MMSHNSLNIEFVVHSNVSWRIRLQSTINVLCDATGCSNKIISKTSLAESTIPNIMAFKLLAMSIISRIHLNTNEADEEKKLLTHANLYANQRFNKPTSLLCKSIAGETEQRMH